MDGVAGLDRVLSEPYSGYQAGRFVLWEKTLFEQEGFFMVSSGSRFLPFVALAAMVFAVPASAQNGRISGTVKDAHGGALSGATVRAANQATGASRRGTSGADGSYTVADLAAAAPTR